jgi:hypothetical protein
MNERLHFKFVDIRTGKATYYHHGVTVDEHMSIMKALRQYESNILR